MQNSKSSSAAAAIVEIYRFLVFFFILFILYYAQTIVIPLIVAGLLTFLLSPLVTRLEKIIGRVASILLVVTVVFSGIGVLVFIFTRQLILFGSNVKIYSENIKAKFEAFHFPQWEIFNRIGQSFGKLKELIVGESTAELDKTFSPLELNIVDISTNFLKFLELFFGSFLNLLGMTGIVILLVIFMLLNREDIRGRIIKLIGQRRISSTTSAMENASDRVSTYLLRQLIVNIGFGITVSIGLSLIGVPNVILWGCLAMVLRFIPYLGSWIAALLPIAFSFIITDTWTVPILTISFFILLELTTAYFIEPFYFAGGTGVSSFALVLAAIFWTWLWGPIGLLLSTPLTVCLVVIGQYVRNMNFLSVLLSQEQALTPAEECYHRLLSFDSNEAMDVVESYLKKESLISLYDLVLIPVIIKTETDFQLELIDAEKREDVFQSIREIIDFLSLSEQKEKTVPLERQARIFCLPVKDDMGVSILTQVLFSESFEAHQIKDFNMEKSLELIEKGIPDVFCIVAVAPFGLSQIRYLCNKVHQRFPQLTIVLCLWGFTEVSPDFITKLNAAGASKITLTLAETIKALQELLLPASERV